MMSNNIAYPDPSDVTILGEVFARGIYAKALDDLQIASSGRISVYLQDQYVFDLSNDGRTTSLTPATDSRFTIGTSNVYIEMDTASNSLYLKSDSLTLDGELRIINNHNDLNNFIFRANASNELELIKILGDRSNVIARFGRKLMLM